MKFRTTIIPDPSNTPISYNSGVMFIGSCFAAYMGEQMKMRKMPVMINPTGTVYNPVSVLNTLDAIITLKITSHEDVYNHNGTWLSFNHYTDFCADDPEVLIKKINENNLRAADFLNNAEFLFITFGTARVYRFRETGIIVSNCHRIPNSQFENELLEVSSIVGQWLPLLDKISVINPGLRIVFTISPVRHWKDGAHGNQVSKSVLFLAVEELLKHRSRPGYFPAYELLMDDLRDYRFYADDMLHPSSSAVEYIWERFSEVYFDKATSEMQSEILKITRAMNHRFISDSKQKKKTFAENVLNQISKIEILDNQIDLSVEKDHFLSYL
ncbi:MAG TPA: GSCFA domain-containing protein [Bacteroidales bacterium]|nr:GSCFA domain-containing protein [Bacteroidales bacterium]